MDEDGFMNMVRKKGALTFADNRSGMFVMLSSSERHDRGDGRIDVYGWDASAFLEDAWRAR
jgi:hypothetical protein